jgi:hypothetical protein
MIEGSETCGNPLRGVWEHWDWDTGDSSIPIGLVRRILKSCQSTLLPMLPLYNLIVQGQDRGL